MSENPEKNRTTQKAVSRNAFENGMRITSSFHPREWSKSVIGRVRPSRLELSRVIEVLRFASLHLRRVGIGSSIETGYLVGVLPLVPRLREVGHRLQVNALGAVVAADLTRQDSLVRGRQVRTGSRRRHIAGAAHVEANASVGRVSPLDLRGEGSQVRAGLNSPVKLHHHLRRDVLVDSGLATGVRRRARLDRASRRTGAV